MKASRYMYTILKNPDGKFWLWFDEKGEMVSGKYVPYMKPYHEIETNSELRIGAQIWTEDLMSIPESTQLRPLGEYSEAYVVKARIRDESQFLAEPKSVHDAIPPMPSGRRPGTGPQ